MTTGATPPCPRGPIYDTCHAKRATELTEPVARDSGNAAPATGPGPGGHYDDRRHAAVSEEAEIRHLSRKTSNRTHGTCRPRLQKLSKIAVFHRFF
eukprot:11811054-Karenia_brevis.AAC.1